MYVSIAFKNEDGCLLRCNVLQSGRAMQKLATSMFRIKEWGVRRLSETSVCNTPHGVELLKSVILNSVAVRILRLHVLTQCVTTPYPSLHATHPVHIIPILSFISYDGRGVFLCRCRHTYPCALFSTTPLRCVGSGGPDPHILNVSTFTYISGQLCSSTAILTVPCPCRESNTDPPVIWTGHLVTARDQLYFALTKPIFFPPHALCAAPYYGYDTPQMPMFYGLWLYSPPNK